MAFTSWSATVQTIKDAIADRTWQNRSISIDGLETTFTHFEELLKALRYAQHMAELETTTRPLGRVLTRNGGQ